MALAGRLAIVTGAGSGIGRASSRVLAKEGAILVVADRNIQAAEETVSLIGGIIKIFFCYFLKLRWFQELSTVSPVKIFKVLFLAKTKNVFSSKLWAIAKWQSVFCVHTR